MNGNFFLDTNIFVYSFDDVSLAKAEQANRLIHEGIVTKAGAISYQVIQEFFNVVYRRSPMRPAEAEHFMATVFRPLWVVHPSPAFFLRGMQLMERFHLQWYDSLIVAGAIEAKCSILYSEDFQHGQKLDGVEVRNPFL
jgi:predicted nucleic acid-binding protein